ncbi:hypothetical protein [Actinomadura sp. WMMA1423]|uniref:hypothetical protein n=1 Tax=Actinomadura sp. WMMA1423 TaxID=2591108 RepID=UPI001146D12A|nr:hypothetical protein [Actinomadura sp. WMMA1423]
MRALDAGTVDSSLAEAFVQAGYTEDSSTFTVDVTTPGSLWLVTDNEVHGHLRRPLPGHRR